MCRFNRCYCCCRSFVSVVITFSFFEDGRSVEILYFCRFHNVKNKGDNTKPTLFSKKCEIQQVLILEYIERTTVNSFPCIPWCFNFLYNFSLFIKAFPYFGAFVWQGNVIKKIGSVVPNKGWNPNCVSVITSFEDGP